MVFILQRWCKLAANEIARNGLSTACLMQRYEKSMKRGQASGVIWFCWCFYLPRGCFWFFSKCFCFEIWWKFRIEKSQNYAGIYLRRAEKGELCWFGKAVFATMSVNSTSDLWQRWRFHFHLYAGRQDGNAHREQSFLSVEDSSDVWRAAQCHTTQAVVTVLNR